MNSTSSVAWTALRHSLACAVGLPNLSAVSSFIYVASIQIQQPASMLSLDMDHPINAGVLASCAFAAPSNGGDRSGARVLRALPTQPDAASLRVNFNDTENDGNIIDAAQPRLLAPLGTVTVMIVLRTTTAQSATQAVSDLAVSLHCANW